MSCLERDEIILRTKGMSREEQKLAVMVFPDELLWEELQRRYSKQNEMLKGIKAIIKEEKSCRRPKQDRTNPKHYTVILPRRKRERNEQY